MFSDGEGSGVGVTGDDGGVLMAVVEVEDAEARPAAEGVSFDGMATAAVVEAAMFGESASFNGSATAVLGVA